VSIVLPDGERVDAAVFHLAGRWSERWSKAEAPLVSIVIPCYNQAHFLRDAIESVRRQTYPNVEIVVVDDGSTDDTSAVAAELGARCIRQENRGLAAARNRGLAESSGEYLVFLDADDRLLPHGIEANMDAFETRPEAAFVSGWFRPTTPTGDPIPWEIPPPAPPEGDPYVALLEASYWTVPGAAMFRRGPLTALGAFNAAFRGAEDWDLEMRMARKYPAYAHGSGPISEYRQHPASMSRDAALMVESCLGALKAQRQDAGGDESLTAAYRGGVARVQGYFGEALATDLAIAIRRRSWGRAIRAAWVLARRYPGGLLSTWGKLGAPLE